jgi:putative PIN family toxin of toxin-antitoxin system
MKVFLDTNVIVSAIATRGLCADVLREALTFQQLVVSAPLLSELKQVLVQKFGVPDDLVAEVIELIQQDALISIPSDLLDVEIHDKDDVIILSSAINGKADLFVTGDKELLELHNIRSMEIISPRMFWEKLKTPTSHES